MKKKLLATGVAVALGALSGVASAAITPAPGGVGQINILPYYSVQEGNDTLISITNTDTTNGKAVKVRFRGAEWSDDVFDFQIFLSPGDMWTGAVTKDGNLAKLSTSDSTCTLPASVNQSFVPVRLDPAKVNTGTLEGYVEVITMANIPPTGTGALIGDTLALAADWANTPDLYNAIKHVAGGAPACRTAPAAQTLLNDLVQDNVVSRAAIPALPVNAGMAAPVGPGLSTFATIINVPTSKAFTFQATALVEDAPVKQYFRQSNDVLPWAAELTSDNIFRTVADGGTALPMYQFDMPDLSTPTNAANLLAVTQRNAVATQLQRGSVSTEYVTSDSLLASTDVVLSQPVRRYFYVYDDTPAVAANPNRTINGAGFDVTGEAASKYASLVGATNRIAVRPPRFFDRNENTFSDPSDIVISPTPPSSVASISLAGEVSVVSINNSGLPTGALNASITANDYTATGGFADGWASLSTTTELDAQTLPVIGFTAINLFNKSAGAAGTNYGMTLPLK